MVKNAEAINFHEQQFYVRLAKVILINIYTTIPRTTSVALGEIHLAIGCMYRAFHLARGIYSAPASVTQYSESPDFVYTPRDILDPATSWKH